MIGDRVKYLREQKGFTQTTLANKLGISRSSVNSWEMGISNISIKNVVRLAIIFNVSSDFLLELDKTTTVDVSGLSIKQVSLILLFVEQIRNSNSL
jgi:transcriptional regulator with XRE-family HTH domain